MVKEFLLPEEALRELLEGEVKTVLVLGASDSGKTTLIEQLTNLCASRKKTAILDIDPGQSHIGPPTTIAWAMVKEKFPGWDKLKVVDFYFVGDTSPTGNLLPTVTGARIMWDKASKVAERIIVDTTGLIRGEIGKVLKLHLVDLLKPQMIFALCKEDELDHILTFFRGMKVPRVFKLPVPPQVNRKDFSQRRIYREIKFKNYFEKAKEIEFVQEEIGFNRTLSSQSLNLRLVSLRDRNNQDMALGIIKKTDKTKGTVLIHSPVLNPERVGAVVLGRLKLTPEGKELHF
jgi:polynucleotide 5'-hydroxyl-kinase GRC3/NOL9